jgi:hypothetical protein
MLTDDERRRVRAWLAAEIGREPDQDIDDTVEACLSALRLPDDAGAEVFVELDALLDVDDEDEAAHIAAQWAMRFGPIRTTEQFEAIIRTARLGRLRRAAGASSSPDRDTDDT